MNRANKTISAPSTIIEKPDKSWENDISIIGSFGDLQIKIANQFRHEQNEFVEDYKEEFFDIKNELRRVYSEAAGRMGLPMTEDGIERAVERASQIILEEAASKPTINKVAAPLRPAELWANRPNKRGESPSAWIQRVYAAELQAGTLTRAAILEADQPLYQAYATWIRRHPEDDLKLQTQMRTNLDELHDPLTHRRAQVRASTARYRLKVSEHT